MIDKTSQGFKAGQTAIDCLKDKQYRFLGAPEQLLQDQKLALETAAKTYLQRTFGLAPSLTLIELQRRTR